jgi:hypothetical protein
MKDKWGNMSQQIRLRKLLTGDKAIELRNLGNLAYEMKCK